MPPIPCSSPAYQFCTVEYLISALSSATSSTTAACNWLRSNFGANSNTRKLLLLRQRNSKLLKRPQQLRIDFFETSLRRLLFRRAVIDHVLVVDFGKGDVGPPARFFHLQPIPIGLQTKIEQP